MSAENDVLKFRIGILGALVAPLVFLVGVIAYFVVFAVFDMNALTASGIVGLLVAALFATSYSGFWDAVMEGVSSRTAVMLLLILLVVSMIAALIAETDVASGLIWLASELGVGGGVFIPVIFAMTCAIAMSTGTSIGTLFTAFPIFYPAGVALGADPLLLAGAILSGALFGDNLAPISDSSIVSAATQRYRNREGVAEVGGVVRSRAKYALTAAAISFVIYLVLGPMRSGSGTETAGGMGAEAQSPLSLVMLGPVALLLLVAFWKRDIFLAATVGLVSGIIVGLATGLLAPSEIMSANEDGTPAGFLVTGVVDILPLIGLGIVIFGIIGVVQRAGLFDAVVERALRSERARTPRGAEMVIGGGAVFTGTIFAGVNGPCMIMFGPVADRVGALAGLHPYRRANVMDCFTLGLGSIVPVVSSFLLIASQLTQGYDSAPALGAPSIFLTAIYPLVLTVVMIVAVMSGWGRRFEGPDGAEVREPWTPPAAQAGGSHGTVDAGLSGQSRSPDPP